MLEAVSKLFGLLGDGLTDVEAQNAMGLDRENYTYIKTAMYRCKSDEIRGKSTEETYVDYLLAQKTNLADLTAMIQEFKKSKQYNAMVGAIRARSDILNHLINRGQEFGLIEKRPDEKRIIAGVMVANLTNRQLQSLVVRELGQLDAMRNKFGDGSGLLALDNPQVYPALPGGSIVTPVEVRPVVKKKKTKKTVKAATSKVYMGRRVVKKKKILT
jgi:hypothetical protein